MHENCLRDVADCSAYKSSRAKACSRYKFSLSSIIAISGMLLSVSRAASVEDTRCRNFSIFMWKMKADGIVVELEFREGRGQS